MVSDEILALSHMQRKLNVTNPVHGAVLAATQAAGNAQLLIANSSNNQTIPTGNLILTAGTFTGAHSGDGSALTNIAATALTGTIADARLSTNVPLKNAANTFTAAQLLSGTAATVTLRGTTSTDSKLIVDVTGDTQNRFRINAAGLHEWGSGAAVADTNLFRSAANTLRTDDAFIVGGVLTAGSSSTVLTNAAGQILNTATTATSANTNNAIVARDGTGSFGATMITISGTPTNATDVATVSYVQSYAAGFDAKASVRLGTAAALPTNTRSVNVLTASANGALSIDGVAVVLGDRVLVKNEANPIHNGIYIVTNAGAVGAAWVLTRATDFDGVGEASGGVFVFIESPGTVNGNTGWVVTANGTLILNTDAVNWTQFTGAGSFNAGNGLTQSGNTINIAAADTTITVNADSIQVGSNSLTDTHINTAAAIGWTKISKTGSSLADLTTRLASDLTGTLADARLTANVPLKDAANTFTVNGTNSFGNAASAIPVELFRDATAGASANSVSLAIGNSGASQGDLQVRFTNAAATAAPTGQLVFQPRNNANTGVVTTPGTLTFTKTAAADTISIALANAAGSITLNAAGTTTLSGATTVASGGLTVTAGGLVVTAGGLTVAAGTVSLPNASIADAALSANVPLLAAATNSFTGAIVVGQATAGSAPTSYFGRSNQNNLQFDSASNAILSSIVGVIINIDSDNSATNATFKVRANTNTNAGGIDLFTVDEAGLVTATLYAGSGANLTSLPAAQLTGSIADARLSANVPLESAANVFTAQNDFQGKVVIGNDNQDILEVQSISVPTDTRNETITYNVDDTVNVVTVKDGVTTVMTATFAYNGDGTVATKTVVVGGKTITYTYAYTSGNITGVTKTVV